MAASVENLTCPGCGEPWSLNMTECPSCHRPVVISTFNSVCSMSGSEASKYATTYRQIEEAGGGLLRLIRPQRSAISDLGCAIKP